MAWHDITYIGSPYEIHFNDETGFYRYRERNPFLMDHLEEYWQDENQRWIVTREHPEEGKMND